MNEDIRADLIQRNSVALSTSDPTLFPGMGSVMELKKTRLTQFSVPLDLPAEVDHYHDLVPLETHTLNHAIKSNTYGLVTSTYKASNSRTGMRYCLKRIHGKI